MSKTENASNRVAKSILINLNCPRSLTVFIMLKYNDIDSIVNLTINPDDYNDPNGFRDAYLATKLLSKQAFMSTTIDQELAARTSFLEAEASCKKTNRFFSQARDSKVKGFDYIHNACIRKIEKILGPFITDEMLDCAGWGPGVSLDVKGDTSGSNKFRLEGGTTELSHHFISKILHLAYPAWMPEFVIHPGNKIVTVPKNAKTHRTIAVEPGINLWFQKGIGTMVRRRLQRAGVNLLSQERNQKLARLASITGHLATVDFSSASDTISKSVVRELLPYDWHKVMCIFRSSAGVYKDQRLIYEKFSSMGNGFTFELESLIFFAIAVSVCEYLNIESREVSVFGDDVIIPTDAYRLFSDVCAIYGFSVNKQKSYSTGYFRESCGVHYYNGKDCKPLFIKERVSNEIEIYKLANAIRRLSHRSYIQYGYNCCDRRFRSSWLVLFQLIKHPCLISENFGDGGFIVNYDEARPTHAKYGIEGSYTLALVQAQAKYYSEDNGLYLQRLRTRSERQFGNYTDCKTRVRFSRKRLLINRWYDLGSWV